MTNKKTAVHARVADSKTASADTESMNSVLVALVSVLNAAGTELGVDHISPKAVQSSIAQILGRSVLCSMATVGGGVHAHINTAYFSFSSDFEIFFLSHPNFEHARNLAANSSMAVAVFSSNQKWTGPDRGLQFFGTCNQLTGRHARRAEASYGARFREYTEWKSSLKPNDVAREYAFYRFVPRRIKVFDEAAFGEAVFVTAIVDEIPK
jgi:uncharacterized protein YhbP (UPF0306 family)